MNEQTPLIRGSPPQGNDTDPQSRGTKFDLAAASGSSAGGGGLLPEHDDGDDHEFVRIRAGHNRSSSVMESVMEHFEVVAEKIEETVEEVIEEVKEVLEEQIVPVKPREEGDHARKLSALALAVLVFYKVSGGPFGCEPSVKAAGPFYALLGFTLFPLCWCCQEALVTAELGSAFPEPSVRTPPPALSQYSDVQCVPIFPSFTFSSILTGCHCMGRGGIWKQSGATVWLLSLGFGGHRQCNLPIPLS